MSLFRELQRRNVLRVGAAYIVTSWLLIQVAETIFPLYGYGDGPARTVVTILAIGFVPVLVFSWIFEWTPDGFRRESDIDPSHPLEPHGSKKLDRIIMVVLALALGYFAFDKFVLDPARDAAREIEVVEKARTEALIESFGQNSLAVLPFVNMSDDPENEYFSDGVAEEVLNLLAKIPDLRVISRSSSFSYRGKELDIPSIAEQLNAALVLEGSVRRYGNQVRITAQLIEGRSDTHLWSETYERELENVFAIQDEISAAIVAALRDTIDLQTDEAPRTNEVANTEAHDAYLRGRHLLVQREMSGAVREFKRAISFEPDYARAHAQLAIAYGLGYLDITTTEAAASAAPHVEKAMQLDPSLAEAHAAAGTLSWTLEENQEALEHFEKAIEINPNYADVYTWMAQILDWSMGRYAEAFEMRKRAVQLDPLSVPALLNFIHALISRGRFAEVEQELDKLSSLAPGAAVNFRAGMLMDEGHWADSVLSQLEALQAHPNSRWSGVSTASLALLGLENEALAADERVFPDLLSWLGKPRQAVVVAQSYLANDPHSYWILASVGRALAGAGDYAEARPYLEAAWQRHGIVFVGPRFNFEHAVALLAARRAAGEEDRVAELIAAIRDNVRRYAEAGILGGLLFGNPDYENGLVHFLAGEDQRGLALIAQAVDDGYFIRPKEAYLQELYDHPGFAVIREKQEVRQAREREKFLSVVCAGNPYEAVWQPAEGTCEQFSSTE